jgi:hypothetical protein
MKGGRVAINGIIVIMKINKMKINKIIIAIAFLPLISIAQEDNSQLLFVLLNDLL